MNDLKCFFHFTFFTKFRLLNFSILEYHLNLVLTITASEESGDHLRIDFRASDDDTFNGEKSVNMFMTDLSKRH